MFKNTFWAQERRLFSLAGKFISLQVLFNFQTTEFGVGINISPVLTQEKSLVSLASKVFSPQMLLGFQTELII